MGCVGADDWLTSDFDDAPRGEDPYAGVFFSKERTERLVEPVLEEISARVQLPPDEPGGFPRDMTVRVISRGEWMSGCPEGGKSISKRSISDNQASRASYSSCTISFPKASCRAPMVVDMSPHAGLSTSLLSL